MRCVLDGGAYEGLGEEHGTVAYAVRAGEPVDGATGVDEYGIDPSGVDGMPGKSGELGRE